MAALDELQSRRLRLLTRILPLRQPSIAYLGRLQIELAGPGAAEVSIAPVPMPPLSIDYCPPAPVDVPVDLMPTSSTLEDLTPQLSEGLACEVVELTSWFIEAIPQPEIVGIRVSLGRARVAGKVYGKGPESEQKPPPEAPDLDERCIHGMIKRYCAECMQKRESRKKRRHVKPKPTPMNPFDVIFPILQPPLGIGLDSPIALPKALYPFQREGVRFLAEQDVALLADEMGLGKSIQAIVAIRLLFRTGDISTVLILSPKSVLSDWERKLWEWAPELRVVTVRGNRDEREVHWASPAHVYLTTYETLRQDLPASIEASGDMLHLPGFGSQHAEPLEDRAKKVFDLAILDEIQKIKNPGAGVTKAARAIHARKRWGLSGTPLENRIEELISVFAFLKPGLLQYWMADWPEKVRDKIRPYLKRRRKADVLQDLPEKTRDDVWLELTDAQQAAYATAEEAGVSSIRARGSSATTQHVLALITQLKLICNMDPATTESCKVDYLLEQLDEVAEADSKALIFSQYPKKSLQAVRAELQAFEPLLYDGSLSERQRDEVVTKFQEDDEHRVLLISSRAGGQGLTLTRANYEYHFDLWWNPAVAAQAEDRAHRIGQQLPVSVFYLYTRNTIEERIYELLETKRALFSQVIDELSEADAMSAITAEELFGLFGLSAPGRPGAQTPGQGPGASDPLRGMSPEGFERLVARLYGAMGFHTRLTGGPGDEGVDIYAQRVSDAGVEHLAIQCKHYPGRVVGVGQARDLWGAVSDRATITRGVLVTSGTFSADCRAFAGNKRLTLVDRARLRGLLEKHHVSPE